MHARANFTVKPFNPYLPADWLPAGYLPLHQLPTCTFRGKPGIWDRSGSLPCNKKLMTLSYRTFWQLIVTLATKKTCIIFIFQYTDHDIFNLYILYILRSSYKLAQKEFLSYTIVNEGIIMFFLITRKNYIAENGLFFDNIKSGKSL